MSHKKILIVEDEEDINALVALNLEILGHEVTRCYDGLEGYQKAGEAASLPFAETLSSSSE